MYAAFPFRAPVSLLDIRKFKNPTMLPLILNRPRRRHTYYIYTNKQRFVRSSVYGGRYCVYGHAYPLTPHLLNWSSDQ